MHSVMFLCAFHVVRVGLVPGPFPSNPFRVSHFVRTFAGADFLSEHLFDGLSELLFVSLCILKGCGFPWEGASLNTECEGLWSL